jgi:hypothetical protein
MCHQHQRTIKVLCITSGMFTLQDPITHNFMYLFTLVHSFSLFIEMCNYYCYLFILPYKCISLMGTGYSKGLEINVYVLIHTVTEYECAGLINEITWFYFPEGCYLQLALHFMHISNTNNTSYSWHCHLMWPELGKCLLCPMLMLDGKVLATLHHVSPDLRLHDFFFPLKMGWV